MKIDKKDDRLKAVRCTSRRRKGGLIKTAKQTARQIKNAAFKNQKECEKMVNDYFATYLPESGEVADIESLADYLGTTRDEIMSLLNDKRFGKTLKLARNRIAKIKKQLAFGGKIPAAVLSFDLKNNHGYRDKPDDNEACGEQVVFKGKTADWAQ
ncbi:MAG: hypothetical protein IJO64_02315 [Clostridia bacterium]|nr:hypothetical protein [Clostridia bacterium]MBQ9847878.1 hypothetical protein [Clostridia bacterium]